MVHQMTDVYGCESSPRLSRKDRTDKELADELFMIIEEEALKGNRCPTLDEFRDKFQFSMSWCRPVMLADAGRVVVEIYCWNWRVVTLMEGPNKGIHTRLPPHTVARPYKTYYKRPSS